MILVSLFVGTFSIVGVSNSQTEMPNTEILLRVFSESPDGRVELTLTEQTFSSFAQKEIKTTTPWTDGENSFKGVLIRDILIALGLPQKQYGNVKIHAYASNDYTVEIPYEDAFKYDVIIARSMNNTPLSLRTKGPLWIIYPWT
ncbi:MAG: molybdopterin-dependent oxidoreductase, partial [Alphaproteobacteria bacterium]|nr:molybdopterin-dependent oxidoreductase [Alphaproteobacteria bacterium]